MDSRDFPSTKEHRELEARVGVQEIRIEGLIAENDILAGSLSGLSGLVSELAGNVASLAEELQVLRLLAHGHDGVPETEH